MAEKWRPVLCGEEPFGSIVARGDLGGGSIPVHLWTWAAVSRDGLVTLSFFKP